MSSEERAAPQTQQRRNEGAEILVSRGREDLLGRTFVGDLPVANVDTLLRQLSCLEGVWG